MQAWSRTGVSLLLAAFMALGCGGGVSSQKVTIEQGEQYIRTGNMAKAKEAFSQMIESQPKDARAHFYLGVALANLGDVQGAEAEYRKAIDLNPRLPEAENNLGVLYLDAGRTEEALKHLDAAVAIAPGYAEAHYSRGLALENLDRSDEAVEAYKTAIKADPAQAAAPLIALGQLYMKKKDFDKARKTLEEAKTAAPDDPFPWFNTAMISLEQGKKDEAAKDFLEAAAKPANDEESRDLLFLIGERLRRMERYADAKGVLERLVQEDPTPGSKHLASLALVLEKMGDVDGAVARLREAIQADPRDPSSPFLLGNVLARAKRFKEAADAFRDAMAKDSEGKIKAQAAKALSECEKASGK